MLKSLLLFLRKLFLTKSQLILENVFLHKQLEIYQRNDPKLKISGSDRMFFSLMKNILTNWKERLFIVKPNTIMTVIMSGRNEETVYSHLQGLSIQSFC